MMDVINLEFLTKLGFYKNGELTNDYYDCYRLYAYFLLSYLNDLLHLTAIEEDAQKGDNPLRPIKREEKDFYQKLSPLNFFYVRNFLKIEKLLSKDIQFLKDRIMSKNFTYDEEAKRVIESSYKEVVKDHEGSDDVMVTYGDFSSGNFFAPNCAIVLGIRISPQFEEDTEDNPNWLEQYCEREDLVSIIINRVEEEAKKENIVLKVFEYNEESARISNTIFKSY